MSALERLLVISEPDQLRSPAIERAAALAKATGASLDIVVCGGPSGSLWILDEVILEQVRAGFLERQRAYLAKLGDELCARGIQITTEVFWADKPELEVLLYLESRPADLVIKPARHELALKRMFITPLDWQLLRNSPLPLHLVSSAEHALPRKVAAAVDLSRSDAEGMALNEEILSVSKDFAQQCGAELHVVMAYEQSRSFFAYAAGPVGWTEQLQEQLTGNLHGAFTQFAQDHGVPRQHRHFLQGPPAKTISGCVLEQQLDVVVMGTLTHKGLDKVLGSTAEQVLYKVPSIIAVRPPET
ncbi:universal stress protein [Metapseudomonas lalkuanensis]|uniref:Universal stress protein n=1 Tax=Metapseudomonas lalkuanensis TaxID=2604832 RepID=A0A5J6QKN1_9GAMM|nr:universal stress protein [Pseudomonas lalkuanensis]QEY63130.1 universal stress protein [Pseudomonas lalkuanensis]